MNLSIKLGKLYPDEVIRDPIPFMMVGYYTKAYAPQEYLNLFVNGFKKSVET